MTITQATPTHIPAMHRLVGKLAEYEKQPEEFTLSLAQMMEDFAQKKFDAFVAVLHGEVVGMAVFYPRYSTWKGATLHLEDFYIKPEHRRKGIGKLLFDAVVARAKESGAQRLEWEVLDWNEPAISFYHKIGAQIIPGWLQGKMMREDIEDYQRIW